MKCPGPTKPGRIFRSPRSAFRIGCWQDPGPVLDRASAAYQTVTTFSAAFTQVIINPLIGAPDTTRGTLYQMRPNHFAMRFSHPKGDRIVADGRNLWIYTPS